ncbi:protein of unknown function [Halopseudomonas xinjiangensis]|uniref:DUF4174 domain-containing protein n=1 Tax=Halopseudomonas xinjiangensis TaxID=487184 RepID=A0A1H1P690_9GAMM|nr:DUF4174 domain-containing protein [Halopseudomonas xinjiangensis]SDS06766.1 protein of unknown function [Halopseudomonas xinjiangensis]
MRYITLLLLLFSLCAQSSEQPMLTDLSSLQWQNRIIVVNEVADAEKAASLLEDNAAGVTDRDLLWLVFKDSRTLTNYSGPMAPELKANTLQTYRIEPGQVILIGKDGGVKDRLDQVDLEALFADIDAMPMRRNEMRE